MIFLSMCQVQCFRQPAECNEDDLSWVFIFLHHSVAYNAAPCRKGSVEELIPNSTARAKKAPGGVVSEWSLAGWHGGGGENKAFPVQKHRSELVVCMCLSSLNIF